MALDRTSCSGTERVPQQCLGDLSGLTESCFLTALEHCAVLRAFCFRARGPLPRQPMCGMDSAPWGSLVPPSTFL